MSTNSAFPPAVSSLPEYPSAPIASTPHTSAAPETFIGNLLARAHLCILNQLDRHPEVIGLLDESVLIIEDEHGYLMYSQGDLSFLMPNEPLLNEMFAAQLNKNIQVDYAMHHEDVWAVTLPDDARFISKCGRKAIMFPVYTMNDRYTGTVFLEAAA